MSLRKKASQSQNVTKTVLQKIYKHNKARHLNINIGETKASTVACSSSSYCLHQQHVPQSQYKSQRLGDGKFESRRTPAFVIGRHISDCAFEVSSVNIIIFFQN